jgi:hypothetical protein
MTNLLCSCFRFSGLERIESSPPNPPLNHPRPAIIELRLRPTLGKKDEKKGRMKERGERNLPSPLVLNTEWLERVPQTFSGTSLPELFMACIHTAHKVAEKKKTFFSAENVDARCWLAFRSSVYPSTVWTQTLSLSYQNSCRSHYYIG